jgi:mRNA interferase RelE/StbE
MEIEFLDRFNRDLDHINAKSVKKSVARIILKVEQAKTLSEISNVKKLSGFKSAYRIRMGEYRIGFFFENSVIQFARIVHRKDIYKVFP